MATQSKEKVLSTFSRQTEIGMDQIDRYGQIIFLHGPSSSGKSTIAVALQAAIEQPFLHLSIDHIRDSGVLPNDRITSQEFPWANLRAPLFDGFHASLAAFARTGNNLILEHILDTDCWIADLRRILMPFDVYFVGLHCDLAELRTREIERGNREIGGAEKDFHSVHVGRKYDLEISTTASTEQNVATILAGWRSGQRNSDFS